MAIGRYNAFEELAFKKGSKYDLRDVSSYYIENQKSLSKVLNTRKDVLMQYPGWYLIDEEYYYAKRNHKYNELLLSELAKEFDLKCVQYILGRVNNNAVIMSKCFKSENKEYLYYKDLFTYLDNKTPISDLFITEDYLSNFLSDSNVESLMSKIFALVTFDIFSGQKDRYSYNVIFEKNNDKVSLAPIFDNGSAFKKNRKDIYLSCFGDIYIPHYYDPCDLGSTKEKENTICIDGRETLTIELIRRYGAFFDYLSRCLDIDIPSVIKRTNRKYNLLVTKEERDYLIGYFDKQKKNIELTLNITKKGII